MQELKCEAGNDELLRAMKVIEELSPYWALIGIKVEDVGKDCAIGSVEIGRKHLQVLDTVHGGGVHAALVDAMAWVAVISHYYPRYVIAVTTDLTVKYLKPIAEGGVLKAVARVIHVREPIVLITAELMNRSNDW
ncbi:PaaI family thioesterase [Vulcanisaeta souniana]|uniref:PaaI family thioesterase n=1 Tax=Vulcanisaeta souniana TaxID=164452 RepID=UPI000AD83F18|nr:PaaI family thioesterase [Vulcanisaeta souniana]